LISVLCVEIWVWLPGNAIVRCRGFVVAVGMSVGMGCGSEKHGGVGGMDKNEYICIVFT